MDEKRQGEEEKRYLGQPVPTQSSFDSAFSFVRESAFYHAGAAAAAATTAPQSSSSSSSSAASAAPQRQPQPKPQPQPQPQQQQQQATPTQHLANPAAILVSHRQRGNGLLGKLKNVPYEYSNITADYDLGSGAVALFISIRYHLLNPTYLYRRIKELRGSPASLRVVLCLVDVSDNTKPLHDINHLVVTEDCTLILAWSSLEAARYLETFKLYATKSSKSIEGVAASDSYSQLCAALTTVRSVNKTDVATLTNTFGSLGSIFNASAEELALCPGMGEKKVRNLLAAFNEPFDRNSKKRRTADVKDDEEEG